MLRQSRFQFTADDREALAKHLCEGGHAERASEIIDAMEDHVRWWRDHEVEEMSRRAMRDRDVASAKKINRRQGKKVVTLPRENRGPKTFSRRFVISATSTLIMHGVRIVRGPDKHQWLEDFLVELCRIAGQDRPSVAKAIEVSARAYRAADADLRVAQQGGPLADWMTDEFTEEEWRWMFLNSCKE
jgi:hypothetical protein